MNRTVETAEKSITGVIDLEQDSPGVAVIPLDEYRELVGNQAMLDMVLMTRASRGYYDDNLIRMVHELRAAQNPDTRVWVDVKTGVDENGIEIMEKKLMPELKGGDGA